MNLPLLIASIFVAFLGNDLQAQIQCVVDIQILEGATISICEDNPETISGTSGFVSYSWTGPETLAGVIVTPNFSGQYILSAVDGMGCVSLDTIQVTIYPNPLDVILSSAGNTICPGVGTTLSLAGSYASYTWSDGSTTPTIFVPAAGTIDLAVVDNNGCPGLSSITINEFNFSITNANNFVCNGGSVELSAAGGTSYLWSTGEISSSIVVAPTESTDYSVEITNGTCVSTLTETVATSELEVFALPDVVYVGVDEEYFLSGPASFSSYFWSPSNQLSSDNGQSVFFAGTETQWIALEATHSSGCVLTEPILMIVVNLTIPNGFSPNGDDYNDFFVIPELGDYPDTKLTVWNRWGDLVLEEDNYQNNWNGTCQTSTCLGNGQLPEGTYFYLVDVHEVTFKGYITLKR